MWREHRSTCNIIVGLFSNESKCKSTIQGNEDDTEHAFRCILSFRIESPQPHRRLFFHVRTSQNRRAHITQWSIFVSCGILKVVVTSAAEAELGTLFLNCCEAKIIRLILSELGHEQPPTHVHCNNKTTVGIANNTDKKQRSHSMEMHFFWVADQVQMGTFDVQWHPGQENLAD